MKQLWKISAKRRAFYNFTLLPGQIYGQLTDGFFVLSDRRPQDRGRYDGGVFTLYVLRVGMDDWHTQTVYKNSPVGRMIAEAIAARGSTRVQHPTIAEQVHNIYNPRIVTAPYIPMRDMRIPGGADPYCYTRKPQKPKTI